MMTNKISKQIIDVKQRIANATQNAGQINNSVQLLAVSKTKPVAAIKQAYQAGLRQFGENYVQESIEKIKEIRLDAGILHDIVWHFIGSIQSNKTRLIAAHFDWVQSVENIKIARRLNDQRPQTLKALNICLQVNVSEEQAKSGANLSQIIELASQINTLPNLILRGIMAIPKKTDNLMVLEAQFNLMHSLFATLKETHSHVDTLSMGMSRDLSTAIKCGSTMVRIGTDIFGSRN